MWTPSPLHVLLLNASPDESEMYALWLESCGYRITVAHDLLAARRIVRRDPVDVLVIDAQFGACRDEFEQQWTRSTDREALRIVVLSGYLTDADRPVQRGARTVCLFKPCLPQQLSGWISDLLAVPQPASFAGDQGKPVVGYPPP